MFHLALARHFLGPPGLSLLAPLFVVACSAAHREHCTPRDVEHLATHQVQHVRSRHMNEASVPLPYRQLRQQMMVLVVAVDKTRGPGLGLKPVKPVLVGV